MGSRVIHKKGARNKIENEVVRPSKKTTMISVTRTKGKYCETPHRQVM